MSINKIYLPELSEMVSYLEKNGHEEFYIRYVRKREAFLGPIESVEFIHKIMDEYNNLKDEGINQVH